MSASTTLSRVTSLALQASTGLLRTLIFKVLPGLSSRLSRGAGAAWRSRRRLALLGLIAVFVWGMSATYQYTQRLNVALSVNKWERFMTVLEHAKKPVGCVSWRATQLCSAYGPRQPSEDLSCRSFVQFQSGYCECENNVVVALVGCGMHSFTCFDRCRELGNEGMKLPEALTCRAPDLQLASAFINTPAGTAAAATLASLAAGEGRQQAARTLLHASHARGLLARQAYRKRVVAGLGKAERAVPQLGDDDDGLDSGIFPAPKAIEDGDRLSPTPPPPSPPPAAKEQPAADSSKDRDSGDEEDDEEDGDYESGDKDVSGNALPTRPVATGATAAAAAAAAADVAAGGAAASSQAASAADVAVVGSADAAAAATAADLQTVQARGGTPRTASSAAAATGSFGSAILQGTEELWEALVGPVRAHPPRPGPLPGKRTEKPGGDWVMEGKALPRAGVLALQQNLKEYIADVSPPPGDAGPLTAVPGGVGPPPTQKGRGVVVVSGGLRYMLSAWVGVAMLRRTGCTLPVEMWFPLLEYPTPPVVAALRAQGVVCRAFAVPDLDQAGFSLKVAAILLSSFEEVLFLDADNFAVRDPAVLFDSPEYRQYGTVLWRDYWDANVAPELHEILGLQRRDMPPHSFEAGQMLIDKRRHWLGLRVALYLNYYHETFFDLFTDYFGWGDKETFYYAFLAAHEPAYYNPAPVGSVGLVRPFCRRYKSRQVCRDMFTGNTMVQYGLGGNGTAPAPLFLHSNLNKWTLHQPDNFERHYTRRWRVLQPEGEDFPAWSQRMLGVDLERFAYDAIRAFRCAPWFEEYYTVRLRHGEPQDTRLRPLGGLHEMVPGVEFHQLYRAGYGGEYGELYERSQLDELLHSLGRLDRTVLVHLKRGLRSYVWGGGWIVKQLQAFGRTVRSWLMSLSM